MFFNLQKKYQTKTCTWLYVVDNDGKAKIRTAVHWKMINDFFHHLKLLAQYHIYFTAELEHRHLSAKVAVNEYMDRNLDAMEACTDLKVECYSLLLMINVNLSVSIDRQRWRMFKFGPKSIISLLMTSLLWMRPCIPRSRVLVSPTRHRALPA